MPRKNKKQGELKYNREQSAEKQPPINIEEQLCLKRNRCEQMNLQYQASDPIHSSERRIPPERAIQRSAAQTSQIKKNSFKKQLKTKKLIEKDDVQVKQKTKFSSSKSNDSSSEDSQSQEQQHEIKYVKKGKSGSKSKNQTKKSVKDQRKNARKQSKTKQKKLNENSVPKKPKGYVYKPPKPKPIKKQQSINEIQRQFSRISRKKVRKSNFYLDKIDSMKWGQPVGRGAKKLKQQMEQQNKLRRQKQKQRKKQQKKARQLRLMENLEKSKTAKTQHVVLSDSDHQKVKVEAKIQNLDDNQEPKSNLNGEKMQFNLHGFVLEKLIDIYTYNAYDLVAISRELPHLAQKQIRFNLNIVFLRCIEKIQIQYIEKFHEKVTPFTNEEKYKIVNEFYKKKKGNRLLNMGNITFNHYFNKILYSTLNPQITIESQEIKYLWQNITLFLRSQVENEANNNREVKQEAIYMIEDSETKVKQQMEITEDPIKKEVDDVNSLPKIEQVEVKQQKNDQ